ncbi:MAG TPA: bifunctional ornithine acetyltransferase/N-acetylglutamate synthase [Anaeromyxobacteraceae bacterium]|jgi:glutamate N-acetyltransferase/amino-acid N-acetyltransferase|nr:bifunctional ornithine acetyltransferase/N-acetylglutamate synthase [Anaeromyxobacteraceae bacterium]
MASTALTFQSAAEHRAWLATQARLPRGFRAGTAALEFAPVEVPTKRGRMNLTLVALDRPSAAFAAAFTRNAFPGAPVLVGRRRLAEPRLGALVVNNKVSNVCAPGGEEAAERICAEAARLLGLAPAEVLPSSTGVIGWRLPVEPMLSALPAAVAALQGDSLLPAAEAIMTTDLYPKVRRAELPGGASLVGIAKGAGMIEPDLATMLVFLLTDAAVPRQELRAALAEANEASFNSISIDSDTSTSDTVALVSSGAGPAVEAGAFRAALRQVCRDLAEDVVRNGEGVHHVIRARLSGAPDFRAARALGKSLVNSPLLQCAVAGNDPNLGRILCAVGKLAGREGMPLDPARVRVAVGGEVVFEGGAMRLDPAKEERLVAHLRAAEMYASAPPPDGLTFKPPHRHPPHERCVEIAVELGMGDGACEVLGADRTHEYVTENADYRS